MLSLYISLPLICMTRTWNFQKLLSYMFYGGNVVRVLVHFFFTAAHFHLALVAASISHFVKGLNPGVISKVGWVWSLQDKTDYLNNVFSKNNYNTDFVRWNTHSNTDSNSQTNVNSGPVTTATIQYLDQRQLWNYRTYITTLQYTCCTQTDNHFTTTTY